MYVDVGDARLFFDTIGPHLSHDGDRIVERPTLIVLHAGPGLDQWTARPYFDRFADTHHVLYLDHRGNGRSTGALETCHLDRWADDVRDLCDRLGISKPVVLGHSFGGMVAMRYAARHPDHPARLILASTFARLRLDETFRCLKARGGDEAEAIARRFWQAPDDQATADYMRVCLPLYGPARTMAENLAALARVTIRPEVNAHFLGGEIRHMDQRAALAAIPCPLLVVTGDQDSIAPVVCAEEIVRAATGTNARMEIIADAGHSTHIDAPVALERLIREFLG